jgi:tetratricopeptide (TPR) repeat protein
MGRASNGKKLKKAIAAPESTPPGIPVKGPLPSWTGSVLLHLALIALLGLLVYSNTFDVPFQFDDMPVILESAHIRDISNIPSFFAGLKGSFASRPLLQATLALNFHFGELQTWGYHAVNISLHLLNGVLLYMLILMTGRHLDYSEKDIRPVALCSALLFIAHPVQTEAVTYIVSRSVLFATTFYLLGIILFLKAVTSEKRRGLFIACLLLVSLMGMGSRENFSTFPVMLLIYDLFFISRFRLRDAVKNYKAYLPVLLSLGYFVHLVLNNTYDRSVAHPAMNIPHLDYVLTQFKVHWTYLRLFLFPVGQNLDYDYPISKTLFELPTLLSFVGYIGLWAGGIFLARRRPYMAFSILWFLVALLPISFGVTFLKDLKLNDVIFEHRLYLPGVGFMIAAGIFMFAVIRAIRERWDIMGRMLVPALLVVIVALAGAAYSRNAVWKSDVSLWKDALKKSPGKARPHSNLGIAYKVEGNIEMAIKYNEIAIKIDPTYANAYIKLGDIYFSKGLLDKAIKYYEAALLLNPYYAYVYHNLGVAYHIKGLTDEAIWHYERALELKPYYTAARNNLGIVYSSKGMFDRAIEIFRIAVRLDPDSADSHFNLGLAYLESGSQDEARREFEAALRIDPGHHKARQYLKLHRQSE